MTIYFTGKKSVKNVPKCLRKKEETMVRATIPSSKLELSTTFSFIRDSDTLLFGALHCQTPWEKTSAYSSDARACCRLLLAVKEKMAPRRKFPPLDSHLQWGSCPRLLCSGGTASDLDLGETSQGPISSFRKGLGVEVGLGVEGGWGWREGWGWGDAAGLV